MPLTKLQRSMIKLAIVVILAALLIKVYWPELVLLCHPSAMHQHELIGLIHRHSLGNTFLLVITIAILCSIPFAPNSVVCIFAGVCFGPVIGFLINWCGNIIGNGFVAIMINLSGISSKVRQQRAFHYLTRQPFETVGLTIGFIIPIIPNLLVNCAATGLRVPKEKYLFAVSLGTFPIAFLYALGGNALITMSFTKVAVAVGIFVLLCLFYWGLKSLQAKATDSNN